MEPKKLKPGYVTSEFFLTAVSSLVGLGIMLGYISPEQGQTLQENAKILIDAIEIGIGALLAIVPVIVYIASRTNLKNSVAVSGKDPSELLTPEMPPEVPKGTTVAPSTPSYIVQ